MSMASHQARETVKAERRSGHLINAAGRGAVKAAIFLDNGTIIASPYSVQKLINAVDKANAKTTDPHNATNTPKVRIVDAIVDHDDEAEYVEEEYTPDEQEDDEE